MNMFTDHFVNYEEAAVVDFPQLYFFVSHVGVAAPLNFTRLLIGERDISWREFFPRENRLLCLLYGQISGAIRGWGQYGDRDLCRR